MIKLPNMYVVACCVVTGVYLTCDWQWDIDATIENSADNHRAPRYVFSMKKKGNQSNMQKYIILIANCSAGNERTQMTQKNWM